jgi:RNA polymerase sporulation-specific sigma factor
MRDAVIEHNRRLCYIARKFENTGIGIEDLISIARSGDQGGQFVHPTRDQAVDVCVRCIENEILKVLSETASCG